MANYAPENIRRWPCGERLKEPRNPRYAHRLKVRQLVRRAIYERDNWTCQRCGLFFAERPEKIKHAPSIGVRQQPTRRSPFNWKTVWLEVHHIIPYSLGGANTKRNLVALCSTCNSSIGTRRVSA